MTDDETESSSTGQFEVGYVLRDRYEFREILGEGGFAVVYEAFDTTIERRVAVKVLNTDRFPAHGNSTETIRTRFLREAKTAAQIRDPGIIEIYDFGVLEDSEDPYMIMEFLEGTDLDDEIKEHGGLAPSRLIPLFVGALEALGEAHAVDVIHKDLKPANLFLLNPGTDKEVMKVVDFGIAHINEEAEERLTKTGGMTGTPHYLPPEYLEDQSVRPEMDVYQMGLILIEGLSGRRVIEAETAYQAAIKHVNRDFVIPRVMAEGELGEVLRRAIALDPDERFDTAAEFAEALEKIDVAALDESFGVGQTSSDELLMADTVPSDELDGLSASSGTQQEFGDVGSERPADAHVSEPPESAESVPAPESTAGESPNSATLEAIDATFGGTWPLKALAGLVVGAIVLLIAVLFLVVTDSEPAEQETGEVVAGAEEGSDVVAEDRGESERDEKPGEATDGEIADKEGVDDESDEISQAVVVVESLPSGADVSSPDGDHLGSTPVTLDFADEEHQQMTVDHPEYEAKEVEVEPILGEELGVDVELEPVATDPDPEPATDSDSGPMIHPEAPDDDPSESEPDPDEESEDVDEEPEDEGWALPGADDDDDTPADDEEASDEGFDLAQ